jgi:threonine efflux protein
MMSDLIQYGPSLLVAYTAYLVATVSPGPSNLAIMATAMSAGRKPALALALGVISGSCTWAMLAALGVSALLASFAFALTILKIVGGLYLLYLGWKSARAALSKVDLAQQASGGPVRLGALYRRGLAMHLTNPKAILSWLSIISLGLPPDAPGSVTAAIVVGCVCLGVLVFGGFAILFSAKAMALAYRRVRRWVEGAMAIIFGFAGLKLLISRA